MKEECEQCNNPLLKGIHTCKKDRSIKIIIDPFKLASILADNDEMLVAGKVTRLYREMIRESEEWKERYEYYLKTITNEAEIK